ncbi:CatA-like O-acetyltransferase, partial [Clostridium botulinum]
MKFIDIENWKRKNHYNYFKQLDYPHFNICGNLDITNFYRYIKKTELPFFASVLYASTKTANDIREFRFRIKEDRLIEHEIVSPSFTVMTKEEVFSFCTVNFIDSYNDFKSNALKEIEKTKNNITIKDEPGRDD